jgi:ADP-heptose:LPS heptosyltransferase
MMRPRKILVIRRKALGDILVSLAVVRGLVERWPECAIDLVVDDVGLELVEELPELHRVLIYEARALRRANPWQRLLRTGAWLRRLRREDYDCVIDLMGTPQTAIWAWSTGAPVRVGRARRGRGWAYTHRLPARGGTRFAGEVFQDSLRVLGENPPPWRPVAPFPGLRWKGASSGRILLNPSASWSAKAWPAEHFARAGVLLVDAGYDVAVAWGPGEEAPRDAILEAAGGRIDALPPTNLRELAGEICDSALVITTDSGPKHLAVAQGVPTLTLFGSTDPRGWQPPGTMHRWLANPVECAPCNLRVCPVPGHPCLDELSPRRVVREALSMLASARSAPTQEAAS